jgi:hypothetical protein
MLLPGPRTKREGVFTVGNHELRQVIGSNYLDVPYGRRDDQWA